MPPNELSDLLQSYNKEIKILKEQISDIVYFMKGGIELNSAWGMSFEDREIAIKTINKRLKESNPTSKDYM